MLVDFHDANQYPFSALSGMSFFVGEDVNPNLIAKADPLSMEKMQNLTFHLKNLGTAPLQAKATLVLPRELSAEKQERQFQIGPRSEETVDYTVRNFSALPEQLFIAFFVTYFVRLVFLIATVGHALIDNRSRFPLSKI